MSVKNVQGWKADWNKRKYVQSGENLGASKDGLFLSGESTLIVSGPPVIENTSDALELIPVGLVQQAQLSQNKEINQVFEIGGRLPFFVPGRVVVRASLARVLFDGPSLFYALYRSSEGGSPENVSVRVPTIDQFSNEPGSLNIPTKPYPAEGSIADAPDAAAADANPGRFWTNLASSLFNKPIGLGFILFDMAGNPYGGAYLEGCYVQSHTFGVSANQTVLAENVTLTATRLRPLSASTLGSPNVSVVGQTTP